MLLATLLTAVGLFFDGIGALLVIVPEHKLFDAIYRPQDRIERIDQARETLFTQNRLEPRDIGFQEIEQILEDHLDIPGALIEVVALDAGSWGGSSVVEVRYEPDGGDAEYARPSEGEPTRTLLDRWCEREIRFLERRAQLQFYNIGFGLLALGFGLQIVSLIL